MHDVVRRMCAGARTAGVLKVRGYSKRYASGLTTKLAFQNLNADFVKGEITILYGPNGAGKTSLLRCLAGIASATSGVAMLQIGSERFTPRLRYVPEGGRGFHADLTPAENLRWAEMMGGRSMISKFAGRPAMADVLAVKRPARTLSRGQKQLLSIGMAMADLADFYLLDEPTNGLDPRGEADVLDAIQSLRSAGAGVVIATHDLGLQEVADRVVFLREGKVLLERATDAAPLLKCRIDLALDGGAKPLLAAGFQPDGSPRGYLMTGSASEILRALRGLDELNVTSVRIVETAIASLYFEH